jgi:hypothetical protein
VAISGNYIGDYLFFSVVNKSDGFYYDGVYYPKYFGLYWGHGDAPDWGYAPDYPFRDVNKAMEALQKIFIKLPDCCKNKTSWHSVETHVRKLFSFEATDDKRRVQRWKFGIRAKFGNNASYNKEYFEKRSVYYEKTLGY